jgi:hypothetical protein
MIQERFSKEGFFVQSGVFFDGVDDYISIPNTYDISAMDWTMSVCFKIKSTNVGPAFINGSPIIGVGVNPTGQFRLVFREDFENLGIRVDPTGDETAVVGAGLTVNREVWIHAVVTYAFTTGVCNLYVNSRLAATLTSPMFSTVNDILICKYGGSYGWHEVSNFIMFDKVLDQGEIMNIHQYQTVPETCKANVIHHYPLQYTDISKRSFLDITSVATPVSVNQIGHGFVKGNIIRNTGSWVLADGTVEASFSNPPTIVSNVVDANNFDYVQAGAATITSHGFGQAGDLIFCNNLGVATKVENNNLICRVVDANTVLVGSAIKQGILSANKQYNLYGNSLKENVGTIFGKSDSNLGISNTDDSHKNYPVEYSELTNIYNGVNNQLPYGNTKYYNGVNMYDILSSWGQVERYFGSDYF